MSETTARYTGDDGLLSKKVEQSRLWKLKVKLQFSGWMQYFPNTMAVLVCFLLAGVGSWVGVVPVVLYWFPLGVGSLLLANLCFDLVTVKMGIRPPEAIPKPKDELNVFDVMRARHSCRSFQSRKLSQEHREKLLGSVDLYTRQEVLLGDQPIRIEYIAAPLTVWPTVGAQEFLVALAPKPYNRMSVIDVGRSLQRSVIEATRMGLGTCWIGPGADHQSIIKHLGERFDPDKDHIICVCAIGYPSWFKPLMVRMMHRFVSQRRLPLSSLFFAGPTFQVPLDTEKPPYDIFARCYEVCRWAPSSFNSQTTRCAAVVEKEDETRRLTRYDFACTTSSRYYAPVALGIWCANWEMGCEELGQPGTFRSLSPEERGMLDTPESIRYDISWTLSRPLQVPG